MQPFSFFFFPSPYFANRFFFLLKHQRTGQSRHTQHAGQCGSPTASIGKPWNIHDAFPKPRLWPGAGFFFLMWIKVMQASHMQIHPASTHPCSKISKCWIALGFSPLKSASTCGPHVQTHWCCGIGRHQLQRILSALSLEESYSSLALHFWLVLNY